MPKRAVTPLSMALYELATNSAKYGALASPSGYVRLRCACLRDDARWSGVKSVWRTWRWEIARVLAQRSFGSALSSIEDATVLYDDSPQSVACVFEWPATDSAAAA